MSLEDNTKLALAELIWAQIVLKTKLEESELKRKELEKLHKPDDN